MNDNQIETLLRRAPRPAAPEGLKERLLNDLSPAPVSPVGIGSVGSGSWLQRWFPALSFGCLLLACLAMVASETLRLVQLQKERDQLDELAVELPQLRLENQELRSLQRTVAQRERAARDHQELLDLRAESIQLRDEARAMEILRAENQRLKTARARALEATRDPEARDPFGDALEKAHSIACINNLKRIALAARLWANDHDGHLPVDFASMTAELGTPKILFCPASTVPVIPSTWDQFNLAEVSYVILSPGVSERKPEAVFARCLVHGSIALADGSAQIIKKDARLITTDGVTRWAPQPGHK